MLYECVRLNVSDVAAYVADGEFDWQASSQASCGRGLARSWGLRGPLSCQKMYKNAYKFYHFLDFFSLLHCYMMLRRTPSCASEADSGATIAARSTFCLAAVLRRTCTASTHPEPHLCLQDGGQLVPLLQRTGMDIALQAARFVDPARPVVRLQPSIPVLHFHLRCGCAPASCSSVHGDTIGARLRMTAVAIWFTSRRVHIQDQRAQFRAWPSLACAALPHAWP